MMHIDDDLARTDPLRQSGQRVDPGDQGIPARPAPLLSGYPCRDALRGTEIGVEGNPLTHTHHGPVGAYQHGDAETAVDDNDGSPIAAYQQEGGNGAVERGSAPTQGELRRHCSRAVKG